MHKIVAQCFLVNDQPELKKTVDHKNRDLKLIGPLIIYFGIVKKIILKNKG